MTWEQIIEQVARQLHEGKLSGISPEMVQRIASDLMQHAFKGYGSSFDTPGLAATDFEQLQAIEKNVFLFSGFKNYQQLKETSLLLKDAEGNMRSFADFFADVKAIDKTYNRFYAQAEYNHAQNTSNAISRWKEIQQQKTALRFLTWRTVTDEHNCPVCGELNSITLPVDHPFWRIHFFPAHFNCRCIVEQHDDESLVTPEHLIVEPVYPKGWEIFKHNAGIDGIVFPEKHPYFDVSKAIKTAVTNEVLPLIPVRKHDTSFTPAATVAKAKTFALENELAKKVSYDGIKLPEIANTINQVLLELKQQHGIVYDEIKTKKILTKVRTGERLTLTMMQNESTVSGSVVIKSSLTINKAWFEQYETIEQITAEIKKLRNMEWIVAESLKDVVNHEIGHLLTVRKVYADKMSRFETVIFDTKRLGRYAQSNIKETLAEIYCYYKKTGSAPQEWIDKFNKWSILKIKND